MHRARQYGVGLGSMSDLYASNTTSCFHGDAPYEGGVGNCSYRSHDKSASHPVCIL
jgi:hypothetical protein